ncbi:MAG: hypothetical protein IPK13_21720 [Deltaproteobacteria bacterium]|nr:hypothetical protein [Deltaproteobacteria bacterium]
MPFRLRLDVGQSIQTSLLTLVMQGDGNLVLYDKAGLPAFATYTQANCGAVDCRVVFQGYGNLVAYRGREWGPSAAVWSSESSGKTCDGQCL